MVLICDHLYGNLSKYYGEVLKMCKDVNWEIHENPLQLNNNNLNNVVIDINDTINKRYLALPITGDNFGVIMLSNNEYTIIDLLVLIYEFYNDNEVSYVELKSFSETVEIFTVCERMKIENIESVKLVQILGSPRYFEGFDVAVDKSGDTQYTVLLGS